MAESIPANPERSVPSTGPNCSAGAQTAFFYVRRGSMLAPPIPPLIKTCPLLNKKKTLAMLILLDQGSRTDASFLCRSCMHHMELELNCCSTHGHERMLERSGGRSHPTTPTPLGGSRTGLLVRRPAGIPFPSLFLRRSNRIFLGPVRRRHRRLSKSPAATFVLEEAAFASDGHSRLPACFSSSRDAKTLK